MFAPSAIAFAPAMPHPKRTWYCGWFAGTVTPQG
jgi:hypothetical protein